MSGKKLIVNRIQPALICLLMLQAGGEAGLDEADV